MMRMAMMMIRAMERMTHQMISPRVIIDHQSSPPRASTWARRAANDSTALASTMVQHTVCGLVELLGYLTVRTPVSDI